jgi:hypothetical protein
VKLVFLYGGPAAGKFTVARALAARTGFPLFHNHLVVDAVHAVFPFGSESFVRLREQFWMEVFAAAAAERRSLIFTFQPEGTVAPDFPARAAELYRSAGGDVLFVHLQVSRATQARRIANEDRAAFGNMRDAALLQSLQDQFEACERAMPATDLVVDTDVTRAEDAAAMIAGLLG